MYASSTSDGSGGLFHCSEQAPRAAYRREFDEMEARIRKCERQRAELERQFEELMHERAEYEKATVRARRQRQRRQQEAERQRTERNESILRMLNKIDQQAASLAAKTDRLKMFKTQYEMYLMRTWATSSQALPATVCTAVPMITAPPAMLSPLPQSPVKMCPKSEFVQYLSDLTHQQTANANPIPSPTALSSYLASQQKPFAMARSTTYGMPAERPYSRALTSGAPVENDRLVLNSGAGTSQSFVGGTTPKKFEMSNEDFIRYIDSEVLKEPIPKVSIVSPSPSERVSEMAQPGGAYLEDAAMSEDEPVAEVSKKLDEFNIEVAESGLKKDSSEDNTRESNKELDEMAASGLQNLQTPKTGLPEKEESLEETVKVEPDASTEIVSKMGNDYIIEHDEQIQKEPIAPEMTVLNDVVQAEYTIADDHQGILQEEANVMSYSAEAAPSTNYAEQHETTAATEEHLYTPDQPEHDQPSDDQQYNSSNQEHAQGSPQANVQHLEQSAPQYESRNQHWNTARQAWRSKALPGSSSKPLSPETQLINEQTAVNQPVAATQESSEEWNKTQEVVEQPATVPEHDAPNATYAEYGGEASDPYYQTESNGTSAPQAGGEQMQLSTGEGYHNDAMGQPVEYQQDGQESAAYQYGSSQDQMAYQQGQYIEGETGGDPQYQYQAGADQTDYATQEGYQDPNQQYQYDENAQYYNDQQAYDAQYYSQDAQQQQQQQQQQQYYMDESNQQHEGQYEQQIDQTQAQQLQPADQYPASDPNDQTYYPPEGQYEPTSNLNPDQTQPILNEGVADSSSNVAPADAQPVETSPVIDATLPKDKQEKKAADPVAPQVAPAKKEGAEPGSDAPTLSTVNDESDFDFSSQ